MAYQQFTKCVAPGSFTDLSPESWVGKLFMAGGGATVLVVLVLSLVGAFTPMTSKPAILAAIIMVGEIIFYLTWWLEGRLICLNEEEKNCAIIGRVKKHGLSGKFKGGDDDYSLNIFLAPGQEHLLEKNQKILDIGRGYTTKPGYFEYLHCEIEGDGIHKIRKYMYVILGILTAAFYLPWPIDLILVLIAFIIGGVVAVMDFRSNDKASNPGNPLDVNENLGTLTPGDLVMVRGDWIYDALHAGWHEIHPVKACQIIIEREDIAVSDEDLDWSDYVINDPDVGTFTLEDPANVQKLKDILCGLNKDADKQEEEGSRDDPKHDWTIHPLVDGCKEPVIIL